MQSNNLDGRVVVVSGAGRGIGRAIAEVLATQGASVVVSARTESQLQDVQDFITAQGGTALAVVTDAMSEDSMANLAATTIKEFGKIDAWVNSVGGHMGDDRHPLELPISLFENHLRLNLVSALIGSQLAASAMIERGIKGSIINIGSGDASHAGARVGYTAAKHGLIGLTRSLAMHWGPLGIRVNCVSPGWTNTELNNWDLLAKAWNMTPEQAYQRAADQNLQKRVLEAAEVAEMVAFLVSDGSSGITGQVISVDGGYKV